MRNLDRYAKELEKLDYDFTVIDGKVVQCQNRHCNACPWEDVWMPSQCGNKNMIK